MSKNPKDPFFDFPRAANTRPPAGLRTNGCELGILVVLPTRKEAPMSNPDDLDNAPTPFDDEKTIVDPDLGASFADMMRDTYAGMKTPPANNPDGICAWTKARFLDGANPEPLFTLTEEQLTQFVQCIEAMEDGDITTISWANVDPKAYEVALTFLPFTKPSAIQAIDIEVDEPTPA